MRGVVGLSDLTAAFSPDGRPGPCCVLGQGSFHAPEPARKVEGMSLPPPRPGTPRAVDGSVLDPGANSLDANPASAPPPVGLQLVTLLLRACISPSVKWAWPATRSGLPGVQRRPPCVRWLGPCRISLSGSLICPLPRRLVFAEMKEAGRVPGSDCQRVESRRGA